MGGNTLIERKRALDPTPQFSRVRPVVEAVDPPGRDHDLALRVPYLLFTGCGGTMVASGDVCLSLTTLAR